MSFFVKVMGDVSCRFIGGTMNFKIGRFHIEIRTEMIKMAIYFGIVVVLLFALRPLIGTENAMVLSNSFMIIPMSLSNDYTTKFKYNFMYFSIVYTGFGIAAWIADLHLVSKGIVLFLVVLFLAYSLNRGRKKPLYITFSINFIVIVYNPVTGMNLLVRLIILESFVVAMMIAQWIFNRKRYRHVVKFSVRRVSDEIEEYIDLSMNGISLEENENLYKDVDERITSSSSLFFTKFDQIRKWDRGSQYLRLLSILKRLARIMYRYNKSGKRFHEDTYIRMKEIIKDVDNFNFEKKSFDGLLEDFGRLSLESVSEIQGLEIDNELELFKSDKSSIEKAYTRGKNRFNKYQFLFSLKTAIMASVGVMIMEAFHLPYAYWFFINVCVLSQPFSELGRKKSSERIFNTVLATGMIFVAFHITGFVWVHVIILVALVMLGDRLFKFNFFTIYSAFMALLLGNIMGQGSLEELSVLRLLYVAVASGVVMLVDHFASNRKMRNVFDGMLKEAYALNAGIVEDILSDEFSGKKLKKLFDAKINVNSSIKNMRAYYTQKVLDEYMLNEQTMVRMYNAVYEYVVKNTGQAKEIQALFLSCLRDNDFEKLYGKVSGKNIYAVFVLYDLYETLQASEELITKMRDNLKEDAA